MTCAFHLVDDLKNANCCHPERQRRVWRLVMHKT
jgi:hypothetical protein